MSNDEYLCNELADIISDACRYDLYGYVYFCDTLVSSDGINYGSLSELDKIAYKMISCDATTNEERVVISKLKRILSTVHSSDNIKTIEKDIGKMQKDIGIMKSDIRKINDNMQTFTEVTNLFNDIDKNRNNADDKIDCINKRLDKLEQSINLIINMLQKN